MPKLIGYQKQWIQRNRKYYNEASIDSLFANENADDADLLDALALMLTPTLCKNLSPEIKQEETLCKYYVKGLMAITKPGGGDGGAMVIDPNLINSESPKN